VCKHEFLCNKYIRNTTFISMCMISNQLTFLITVFDYFNFVGSTGSMAIKWKSKDFIITRLLLHILQKIILTQYMKFLRIWDYPKFYDPTLNGIVLVHNLPTRQFYLQPLWLSYMYSWWQLSDLSQDGFGYNS
jgi:hypothetical protein